MSIWTICKACDVIPLMLVLNRRHAIIVSSDERILTQFEMKCFMHFTDDGAKVPTMKSCYGDEHYFPTALALYGEEVTTTCSEGVTFVNWETYMTGHPKTYSSARTIFQDDFFSDKRHGTHTALMCGGRRNAPEGWGSAERLEGSSCGIHSSSANDWGWGGGEKNLPKFNECLFMRKIADELASTIGGQSSRILV